MKNRLRRLQILNILLFYKTIYNSFQKLFFNTISNFYFTKQYIVIFKNYFSNVLLKSFYHDPYSNM